MKRSDVLLLTGVILCAGLVIVFGVPGIIPYADKTLGGLISETVPRLAVSVLLMIFMIKWGYADMLKPRWRARHFLWSIPCFVVAVVNFPFSALIGGAAVIERPDLIWLFLLSCASIALLEEIFFRAILLPFLMERLQNGRYRVILSVLISSALFALMHLVNLFFGAGFGETALQVGYTFLIGCMLAVTLLKTKNVWLCVIIHAVFNIGGAIVTQLGRGAFQDTVFWSLTACAGLICAVHILFSLIKMIKKSR